MADRAQGSVAFTPIVTVAADADADSFDAIHHNIKGSLGGDCTFTVQDDADKWFYAPNVICTTTSEELFGASGDDLTDLVGASGDQSNGPDEAVGSAVTFTDNTTADCSADKIWFLFIKNTGTSDTSGTTTTNSVYVSLDAGTAAYTNTDNIEIKAGEANMFTPAGPLVHSIRIVTGQARGAGTAATVNSSTSVRCTVAAMVEDSSA